MYWTTRGEIPGIFKGGMDGSSPTRISNEGNGVTLPGGITLDHKAGRLYWVDAEHETIWTSNLDGQDVQPVKKLGNFSARKLYHNVDLKNLSLLKF